VALFVRGRGEKTAVVFIVSSAPIHDWAGRAPT
jgi:hypothetical protein